MNDENDDKAVIKHVIFWLPPRILGLIGHPHHKACLGPLVNTSGGPHELWMNSWTLNLQETHGLCSEFYEGFHGIVPLKLAKPRLVSNMSGVICILFCLVGNQAKSIRNIFFFLDLHDLFFFIVLKWAMKRISYPMVHFSGEVAATKFGMESPGMIRKKDQVVQPTFHNQPHRIHGAAIYANIKGVYWWDPCYHI